MLVELTHPALRKKSLPVEIDSNIDDLLKEMWSMMDTTPIAVGLAAPQLGKNVRVFVTRVDEIIEKRQRVFINPKIVKKFGSIESLNESCLSIPNTTVKVYRHNSVLIEYYDKYWAKHKEVFSGFLARVIQHEQDHLNGRLITDYIKPIETLL